MRENGFYGPRSFEDGALAAREVNPIRQFCSATGLPVLAKLILGNKNEL